MIGSMFRTPILSKRLNKLFEQNFSGGRCGPYNPHRYKTYYVPRTEPKRDELIEYTKSVHSVPNSPIRNVRHINPVRESGPLPSYDGTHTMEDIREIWHNTSIGRDICYCQHEPEEIMRRVPGITRKEAEWITKLGLTPDEQVDFAYLAYNIGLDVFYLTNQVFVARQVVTNSKGERVEVLWNSQQVEDFSLLNVGFAPVLESVDYHWEIFLWGEPPIKPNADFDLNVPCTWFEYEIEWSGEAIQQEEQMNLPEDLRPFPTPRNPHSRKELWKSQSKMQEEILMKDEEWYPEGTKYNIYNQPSYKSASTTSEIQNIN